MISKAHEQDNLKNKLGALLAEREKEDAVMLMGEEAEISAETSLLVPDTFPSGEENKLARELKEEQEKEAALSSHQKQQELLVSSLQDSTEKSSGLGDEDELRTLQVYLCTKWACHKSN